MGYYDLPHTCAFIRAITESSRFYRFLSLCFINIVKNSDPIDPSRNYSSFWLPSLVVSVSNLGFLAHYVFTADTVTEIIRLCSQNYFL